MCLQLFVMIICPLIAHSVALAHLQSCLAVHDANPGMAAEGPPAASSFPPVNSYQLLGMNTWKWSRWRMHLSPHKGLQDQASFPRFQKSQNMWKSLTTLTTGSTSHVLIIPTLRSWWHFGPCSSCQLDQLGPRTTFANDSLPGKLLLCTSSVGQMPKHSSLKKWNEVPLFLVRTVIITITIPIYPILGVHNFVLTNHALHLVKLLVSASAAEADQHSP